MDQGSGLNRLEKEFWKGFHLAKRRRLRREAGRRTKRRADLEKAFWQGMQGMDGDPPAKAQA